MTVASETAGKQLVLYVWKSQKNNTRALFLLACGSVRILDIGKDILDRAIICCLSHDGRWKFALQKGTFKQGNDVMNHHMTKWVLPLHCWEK